MSTFAVAAFHDPTVAVGVGAVEAVIWVRAAGLGSEGVDVGLSLWTPAGGEVTALREVAPGSADRLTGAVRLDDHTLRVDAGRWRDGVHELELAVALAGGSPGDELLAARVGVHAGGEQVAGALVAVRWAEAAAVHEPGPDPANTAAVARADLPTGASPDRGVVRPGEAGAAAPCSGCGEPLDDADRFCEACGRELAAG
jgi:hypothetical protein